MPDTLSKKHLSTQKPAPRIGHKRSYVRSSSFAMALVFTIFCGVTALGLGYFINYFAKGHFINSVEAVLEAETRYVEATTPEGLNNVEGSQLYLLLDDTGALPNDIPSSVSVLTEGVIVFTYPANQRLYAARIHTLVNDAKILIGTDISQISKDFKFMQTLGIISIVFVMFVVFFAYLISIFVVVGTNKISQTAYEIIETGDVSRRLDVRSRWDDLSNMAAVLNLLLDRLQDLLRGMRQVSDNIAHDLRTPLTRIRGKLENLDASEAKASLLADTDQLLGTFNALQRISRVETEKQRKQFKQLDLAGLLADVAEFYEPLADEQKIDLCVELDLATVFGDRDLLFQAFANLVDNALKFTPAGGEIHISLSQGAGGTRVAVSDTGVGLDPGSHSKIFDRFYREDKSRTKAGTGLGLSLFKAVVDLHDGDIHVQDQNPGLSIITIL